jgi:hypothetical protein
VLQLGEVEHKQARLQEAVGQMTSRALVDHAQRLCDQYGQERVRLKALLEKLSTGIEGTLLRSLRQEALDTVLHWSQWDVATRRRVVKRWVQTIVASVRNGECTVQVVWSDQTTDTLALPWQRQGQRRWLRSDVAHLKQMLEMGVSQIQIASTFPDRRWCDIRAKARQVYGSTLPLFRPKPIWDVETYRAYLQRTGGGQAGLKAGSGERWHVQELEELERFLAARATQMDIARAFPYRTWEAITALIKRLGHAINEVRERGRMKQAESYLMYRQRKGEPGGGDAEAHGALQDGVSTSQAAQVRPFDLVALLRNEGFTLEDKARTR